MFVEVCPDPRSLAGGDERLRARAHSSLGHATSGRAPEHERGEVHHLQPAQSMQPTLAAKHTRRAASVNGRVSAWRAVESTNPGCPPRSTRRSPSPSREIAGAGRGRRRPALSGNGRSPAQTEDDIVRHLSPSERLGEPDDGDIIRLPSLKEMVAVRGYCRSAQRRAAPLRPFWHFPCAPGPYATTSNPCRVACRRRKRRITGPSVANCVRAPAPHTTGASI